MSLLSGSFTPLTGKAEEVPQQGHPVRCQDGFRMELDAPDRMDPVAKGMDFLGRIRRARRDLELGRERRRLDNQ